jgi:hypothetical protein
VSFGDESLSEPQSEQPSPFPTPEQYLQYLYPPPPRPPSWKRHGRAISTAIVAVAMLGLAAVLVVITGPWSGSKRASPSGLDTAITSAAAASRQRRTPVGGAPGAIDATSVGAGANITSSIASRSSLAPARPSTPARTTAPRTRTSTANTSWCYPRNSSGNCYEPGQLCPSADQGSTGVSGDDGLIECVTDGGLRWEPISASSQVSTSATQMATSPTPTTTTVSPTPSSSSTATDTASVTDSASASGSASPSGSPSASSSDQ